MLNFTPLAYTAPYFFVEDGLTNKAVPSLKQEYPVLIDKHATIQSLYWGKGLPFRQIGMAVWY